MYCLDMASEINKQKNGEYRYILPKPTRTRSNEKRNPHAVINSSVVLPIPYLPESVMYGPTTTTTSVSTKTKTKEKKNARNRGDHFRHMYYDSSRLKALKEEDRGFLLFIITHGRQLATRMPHLNEPEALKTFKMLWSKMTPEHKNWYYNNENTIQTAFRKQHADFDLPAPSKDQEAAQLLHDRGFYRENQKGRSVKFDTRSPRGGIRAYRGTKTKAYQIPRPFKRDKCFVSILKSSNLLQNPRGSGDASEVMIDVDECQRAVDSIINESEDRNRDMIHNTSDNPNLRYYMDVDTSNDDGEFTSMYYDTITEGTEAYEHAVRNIGEPTNMPSTMTYATYSNVLIKEEDTREVNTISASDTLFDVFNAGNAELERNTLANKPMEKCLPEQAETGASATMTNEFGDINNANAHERLDTARRNESMEREATLTDAFTSDTDVVDGVNVVHVQDNVNTIGVNDKDNATVNTDSVDHENGDSDEETEYVMIPCDVKIARMLGWPVHLLPRVSKDQLEKYKDNITTTG